MFVKSDNSQAAVLAFLLLSTIMLLTDFFNSDYEQNVNWKYSFRLDSSLYFHQKIAVPPNRLEAFCKQIDKFDWTVIFLQIACKLKRNQHSGKFICPFELVSSSNAIFHTMQLVWTKRYEQWQWQQKDKPSTGLTNRHIDYCTDKQCV